VLYSYGLYKKNSDISIEKENTKEINFDDSNQNVPDKLIIYLPAILTKSKSIRIIINYFWEGFEMRVQWGQWD